MSTTISPYLELIVSGEGYITKLDKKISWTPESQKELVYYLDDTDGEKSIVFSDITTLKIIMFFSSALFNIKITMLDANEITFITDNFVLTPDTTFIALIDTVTISTSGVTTDKQKINVNLYGE